MFGRTINKYSRLGSFFSNPSLQPGQAAQAIPRPGITTNVPSAALLNHVQSRGMAYDNRVIDHYNNPRNVGSLNKKDKNVGTGLVGAPACGDVMKLQIQVSEDGKTIEKAVFKTFGCGSAIASSSYATELIEGMSIDNAQTIKN